jgi:hypothetical protein
MRTETSTNRKLASFRLNEDLLASLKTAAKRENRSVNNFVENQLMKAVRRKPNKTTLAAIREAREGKNLERLDLENFDAFIASL